MRIVEPCSWVPATMSRCGTYARSEGQQQSPNSLRTGPLRDSAIRRGHSSQYHVMHFDVQSISTRTEASQASESRICSLIRRHLAAVRCSRQRIAHVQATTYELNRPRSAQNGQQYSARAA